jgi:heme ABC exporter ATP-binding subunit CcmA
MLADQVLAIEAAGLSKRLMGTNVLTSVALRVGVAECVAIVGENGSGKTTLLRCLSGALRPDGGSLHWYGHPAHDARGIRRLIGFATHESQLYAQLTAYENLLFAARMHDLPQPARRVEQLLNQIGLIRFASRLPGSMSRGQRQRLSIARALVHRPRILFLDEPFTGLDAPGREWLEQLIVRFRSHERTVCLTTHETAILPRLTTRAVRLHNGALSECPVEPSDWEPAAA